MNNGYYSRTPLTPAQADAQFRKTCMAKLDEEVRKITSRAISFPIPIPPDKPFVATDADGRVRAYQREPNPSDVLECWMGGGESVTICQSIPRKDWRESLIDLSGVEK